MNALVGVGANSAGLLSATPAARKQAQEEIDSNAQAALHGALLQSLGLKPSDLLAKALSGSQTTSASGTTGTSGSQSLGQDTFLQLLVQQMQNQDPMSPMDSTQMVTQLAQFTQVEQMTNMASSFNTMSFVNAGSMIGHTVTGVDANQNPVNGVVTNVQLNGSEVDLTVGNQTMPLSSVSSIA